MMNVGGEKFGKQSSPFFHSVSMLFAGSEHDGMGRVDILYDMFIEIYLEDLSTTWAGNGDHGGWIGVDTFSVT